MGQTLDMLYNMLYNCTMNAKQIRQDAISATRGQIRFSGNDPKTADNFQIEAALNEVRPQFASQASSNQFNQFMREFRKWQKQ